MDTIVEAWVGFGQFWSNIVWSVPFTFTAIMATMTFVLMLAGIFVGTRMMLIFGLLFTGFSIMSTNIYFADQQRKESTVSGEDLERFDALVSDFEDSFIKPDPRAQYLLSKRSEVSAGEVGPRYYASHLNRFLTGFGPILTRDEQESAYHVAANCIDKIEGGKDMAPMLETYPVYHVQLQSTLINDIPKEKQQAAIKKCGIERTKYNAFRMPGVEPKVQIPSKG